MGAGCRLLYHNTHALVQLQPGTQRRIPTRSENQCVKVSLLRPYTLDLVEKRSMTASACLIPLPQVT